MSDLIARRLPKSQRKLGVLQEPRVGLTHAPRMIEETETLLLLHMTADICWQDADSLRTLPVLDMASQARRAKSNDSLGCRVTGCAYFASRKEHLHLDECFFRRLCIFPAALFYYQGVRRNLLFLVHSSLVL